MYGPESSASLDDGPTACSDFAAAMQAPSAYAALHPVAGPVIRIETHVSWVFLAGDYAYKVKKPLRLAFVDYSTVERRAAMCREELRLNRRHAPDLYLDVVPIGGTPGSPVVGAVAGPHFEHALRMRRFDPALELGHLLQAGAVDAGEMTAFGARLARMHAAAAVVDQETDFGTPASVARTLLANLDELRPLLPEVADQRTLAQLRSRLTRLHDERAALLALRRARGCVREGHGDLHCGNVVRWRNEFVAFDALEFDPALRCVDVACDLAFLTMDLAAHGRDDLRRALLQAWLEASGDFEAIALLPGCEPHRALVRAKVAALRGQQARDGSAARTLAHQYLDWAAQRTVRPRPLLVVMVGLSGSGKTWLARRIATALDALVVRSDVERKRLAGLDSLAASGSAPDAGLYTLQFNERTYDRLRECAAACLAGGEHVVVDAANLRQHERSAFADLAARAGCDWRLVHCTAPIDVLRERVTSRGLAGTDASEATAALLDRQPGYWEPFDGAESGHAVEVDTTHAEAIDTAIETLLRLARTPVEG